MVPAWYAKCMTTMTPAPAAPLILTDLSTPDFPGPGIGITDTCGLCRERFDLMYEPDQYPTLPNDLGDPEELICDACQDAMDADRDDEPSA
jgi:hypothetical protein